MTGAGEWLVTAVPVALLLALASAVLLQPARRERPVRRGGDRPVPAVGAADVVAARDVDLGLLLTEVATLLRAGATPQRAWARVLGRAGIVEGAEPGADGVPPALATLAAEPLPSWLPRRVGAGDERRWAWAPPVRRRGRGGRREPGAAPGRRRGPGDGPVIGRVPVPDGALVRRARARRAAAPGAVAACRLTAELGAPLAGVLESVAEGVADAGHADASRRTALSGPRTTARLLAVLPVLGLALGQAVGARPAQVLLDAGWGSAVGVAGLGLMALGQLLTARLVRAAEGRDDGLDEALVLDLATAALSAGASLPGALRALGGALGEEPLAVVGRALLLGASWQAAWEAPQDPAWRERRSRLEASLRPGWEDGASPGPLLAGTARSLRAGRAARDEEAAERLAVRLVVPLGLCFLPAFVLLGIVPVIASVGLDLLAG